MPVAEGGTGHMCCNGGTLMIQHYFTVDVEEYFHVSAFASVVAPRDWARYPSRAAAAIEQLLMLLDEHDARGTFFVLGWLAQRHPHIVRTIAAQGHEVASHGWSHARVPTQTRSSFRADVRTSRVLIEDLTGQPVMGYRAPSFSITHHTAWALDVLIAEGYRYDSSLFPVRRPGYGFAGGRTDVHWIERDGGKLLEVPPATLTVGRMRLPAAGGAYFRLFPYAIVQAAFAAYERRGASGTFYLHPWELDADQPRMSVPFWTRVRHYGGIPGTYERLRRLLASFRFTAVGSHPALR
jgi:polysaccharide deacetylase family protein (PEP-CTERM system associated)